MGLRNLRDKIFEFVESLWYALVLRALWVWTVVTEWIKSFVRIVIK